MKVHIVYKELWTIQQFILIRYEEVLCQCYVPFIATNIKFDSSKKSAKCFCNLFTFLSPQSHCYQKCFQTILLLYVFSALHFDLSAIFRRLFFFSMIRGCTHRSIWGWQGLVLLAHHPSGMLLQYLDGKVRERLTFAAAGLPSTPKDKSLESVRLRS